MEMQEGEGGGCFWQTKYIFLDNIFTFPNTYRRTDGHRDKVFCRGRFAPFLERKKTLKSFYTFSSKFYSVDIRFGNQRCLTIIFSQIFFSRLYNLLYLYFMATQRIEIHSSVWRCSRMLGFGFGFGYANIVSWMKGCGLWRLPNHILLFMIRCRQWIYDASHIHSPIHSWLHPFIDLFLSSFIHSFFIHSFKSSFITY